MCTPNCFCYQDKALISEVFCSCISADTAEKGWQEVLILILNQRHLRNLKQSKEYFPLQNMKAELEAGEENGIQAKIYVVVFPLLMSSESFRTENYRWQPAHKLLLILHCCFAIPLLAGHQSQETLVCGRTHQHACCSSKRAKALVYYRKQLLLGHGQGGKQTPAHHSKLVSD